MGASPAGPPGTIAVSSVQRGILFMFAMTACFASLDASAKWVGQQLPVVETIWGRFVFNLLFVFLFFVRGSPQRLFRTARPGLQALRSVLMLGSTITFWVAIQHMPLADATTIGFAAPLLLTALSVPFLKERVGPYRWGAVLVGLLGVVVAMRPGQGELSWASLLPLLTALCYALYQITTRFLARTDSPGTTLLYTALGGLLMTSLAVPFVWVTPTLVQWAWLAWLGLLGAAGHYCLIRAFEAAPVSVLAPFSYTTLVWAILLGVLVFGNFPDRWTLVGAAIIIASGLFILYRERVVTRRGR